MSEEHLSVRVLVEACAEAAPLLDLPESLRVELSSLVEALRAEMAEPGFGEVDDLLRRTRYLLIEGTDHPVAAILVDRIGRQLGDDIGQLFS
jgi:hypothetical protein